MAGLEEKFGRINATPAYRLVLESRGWEALQPELNTLSKRGSWREMSRLVSDEMLAAIAVCAPPAEVAASIRARTRGVADRVSLVAPWAPDPSRWSEIVHALRGSPEARR